MSKTPYIFNVQRYSIHDGPGIRTVIFLKGCPLRCEWCSNPESQSPKKNIFFNPMLCIGCRTCEKMCPQHIPLGEQGIHKDCTKCGICTKYCPSKALETMGVERSITSLVEEAARDEIYYRKSGGGVTISGGEALLYPEFTAELAEALKKEHYHVALETTGFAPWSDADFVFSRFDLLLYDVKHMNDRIHREFTGVSNEQILKNLKRAAWKNTRSLSGYP